MKAVVFATLMTLSISPAPLFAQSSACLQSDGTSLPRKICSLDSGTTGSIIDQSGTNNLNGNSPIARQPLPKGMDPIQVPSDPLDRQPGNSTGIQPPSPAPLNGNNAIGGNSRINSPSVR